MTCKLKILKHYWIRRIHKLTKINFNPPLWRLWSERIMQSDVHPGIFTRANWYFVLKLCIFDKALSIDVTICNITRGGERGIFIHSYTQKRKRKGEGEVGQSSIYVKWAELLNILDLKAKERGEACGGGVASGIFATFSGSLSSLQLIDRDDRNVS